MSELVEIARALRDLQKQVVALQRLEYRKEMSASAILAKLLTVDGSGSGLDADTVDGAHYETNTWTATLAFGGGSTGITYSRQTGSYVKIGRLVFFNCDLLLSNKGSSTGAVTITGLPFTNSTGNQFNTALTVRMTGATLTGDVIPSFFIASASSTIASSVIDSGTSAAMTDAHFNNTTFVLISGCYIAAS